MSVWRPADVTETAISWKSSLEKLNGPSSLVLTRQSLPELKRSKAQIISIKKGGYILRDCKSKIDAILLSSGSEVHLCVEASKKLKSNGLEVRVVSVPCLEEFLSQSKSYQNKVIPENCNNILAVEAGVGVCWDKLIGKKGKKITMDSFGVSAPGDQALQYFGFTISNVIKQTKKLIKKNG
jgi:transketolase